MKYRIELTENQLTVLLRAVDITMRAGMNQMDEISEWLASHGDAIQFDTSTPEGEIEFDNYIYARDDIRNAMIESMRKHGVHNWSTSDSVQELRTIYQAIRHREWLDSRTKIDWDVRSSEPMQWGNEPVPKIERVEQR